MLRMLAWGVVTLAVFVARLVFGDYLMTHHVIGLATALLLGCSAGMAMLAFSDVRLARRRRT